MREVPAEMEQIWMSGDYTGSQRPIVRATLQHPSMQLRTVSYIQRAAIKREIFTKAGPFGVTTPNAFTDPLAGLVPASPGAPLPLVDALGKPITSYSKTPDGKIVRGVRQVNDPNAPTPAPGTPVGPKGAVPNDDGVISYGEPVVNVFADFLFNAITPPRELPNIRSISWNRSLDADVAECTFTLWNTAPLPIGETPLPDQLDQPGFFTYNRGTASLAGSSRWKHRRNEWYAQLMPDNIIRSYEGYGFSPGVIPERDEKLQPSGVWIIDSVTMSTEGTIEVKCRDLGRILLDQLLTGPIVPPQFDPLSFVKTEEIYEDVYYYEGGGEKVETVREVVHPPVESVQATPPRFLRHGVFVRTNSNVPWGQSSISGHTAAHAIDNNPGTFWLSVGNVRPTAPFAFEYVELGFEIGKAPVASVRFRTAKKGYTAYVSLKVNGQWIGDKVIDYRQAGIGKNQSNIKFFTSRPVPSEDWVFVDFGQVENVEAVRVTLGNLQDFDIGQYQYRGAFREMEVWGTMSSEQLGGTRVTTPGYTEKVVDTKITEPTLVRHERNLIQQPEASTPGGYQDYSGIIKLLLAWAGFFHGHTNAYLLLSDGSKVEFNALYRDLNTFGQEADGEIWGDIQMSGTTGKVKIGADNFHMRPIMDGIQVIKNILLFNFYFDEEGRAQWRQPNLYAIGNWVAQAPRGRFDPFRRYDRTTKVYTIDETKVLISLNATITAASVREGILTYNPQTQEGFITKGYNPNPTGLRRLAGWPNSNYDSSAAMRLTGELIAQRQIQAYRNDKVVVPGFPALQIDDQVRIADRVTSEGYLHYIEGIECTLDMAEGTYEYTLSTHWLGEDPETNWWVDVSKLLHPDGTVQRGTRTTRPTPVVNTGTKRKVNLLSGTAFEDAVLFPGQD